MACLLPFQHPICVVENRMHLLVSCCCIGIVLQRAKPILTESYKTSEAHAPSRDMNSAPRTLKCTLLASLLSSVVEQHSQSTVFTLYQNTEDPAFGTTHATPFQPWGRERAGPGDCWLGTGRGRNPLKDGCMNVKSAHVERATAYVGQDGRFRYRLAVDDIWGSG